MHRKISDLLGQMLRLQDLQVVVARAPMNFSSGFLEDRKFKTLSKPNEQRFTILTREQATELRGAGDKACHG